MERINNDSDTEAPFAAPSIYLHFTSKGDSMPKERQKTSDNWFRWKTGKREFVL